MKTLFSVTILALCCAHNVLAKDVPRLIDTDGPAEGSQPLVLEEEWRAGGEDEDVIFGRIVDVKRGANGNVYVMDNQLCQVVIFSPDGEHLGELGREGDGPGELRQPIGVVLMEDDVVGVGTGFPGRLIRLNLDGTPLPSRFPIGEPAEGNIGVMINIQYVDGVLAATGGRLSIVPGGTSSSDRFLAVCDSECPEPNRILKKVTPLDPTGSRYVERDGYYIEGRWALAPGGRVFVAMERDAYEISEYDRDGTLKRVFGREYSPRKRTQEEKDDVTPLINIAGRVDETVAEDFDECVRRVAFNRADETVWVLTPHGASDQPDGILETWDVFRADGTYLKQVPIPLGHDMNDGACYLVGDDRMVVVRGTNSVFDGDNEDEEDDTEVEPLEVICYKIN